MSDEGSIFRKHSNFTVIFSIYSGINFEIFNVQMILQFRQIIFLQSLAQEFR